MSSIKASAISAMVAVQMAGCAALQPPRVESPALYLLEARPAATAKRPQRDLVLAVNPSSARPGFDTPQIAYVRQPHKLDYYVKNRWADTPSRMLAPLLSQALEQTGSFRAVVRTTNAIPADLRLDTELIRLQHDFTTQPSRVELTLRAQLYDVHSKNVLAVREFDAAESAPNEDAYGGVIAANRVLGRVLGQLADFCVAESVRR
jgi:cholesterol transport system auxiliary component